VKLALIDLSTDSTEPPLGLAYIAAYLRKYVDHHDTVIIDQEDPLEAVRREKPDLVGISALSFLFPEANRVAGEIRKEMPNVPLLIGGYHISVMSHHLPQSNFDIGVIGEGEETAAELVRLYLQKGSFPLEDLRKIKGLVFSNEQGEAEKTERRPLIEPLDRIPMPALDLLKMREIYLVPRRAIFRRLGVYPAILTSRGCPYHCVFCSPAEFWGKFRMFSPERVVDEIEFLLKEYGADGMYIWDDLFMCNRKRLTQIVELIEERGIDKRTRFCIFGRANLTTEASVQLLKRMRVEGVFFGLESGSQPILDYLKQGKVKVKDNYRALRLCRENGMRTVGTIIVGSPDERKEDIEQTLELATSPDLDFGMICHLTPLPGTDVWEEAKKEGLVTDDIDFDYASLEGWGFHPKLAMNKHMSAGELEAMYDMVNSKVNKRVFRIGIGFHELKYLFDRRFLLRTIRRLGVYLAYWRRFLRR